MLMGLITVSDCHSVLPNAIKCSGHPLKDIPSKNVGPIIQNVLFKVFSNHPCKHFFYFELFLPVLKSTHKRVYRPQRKKPPGFLKTMRVSSVYDRIFYEHCTLKLTSASILLYSCHFMIDGSTRVYCQKRV